MSKEEFVELCQDAVLMDYRDFREKWKRLVTEDEDAS